LRKLHAILKEVGQVALSLPLTRNITATCLLILIVVAVLIQNEVVNVEAEIELLNEGSPNEGLEGDRPVVDLLQRGGEEETERFGQVRSLHHELGPVHEVGLLVVRDKLQHLDPVVVDLLDSTIYQLVTLDQVVKLVREDLLPVALTLHAAS
jgi:hypothetical protein